MLERDPHTPGPWGAQHAHTPADMERADRLFEMSGLPVDHGKVPLTLTVTRRDAEHLARLVDLHALTNRDALLGRNLHAQIDAA